MRRHRKVIYEVKTYERCLYESSFVLDVMFFESRKRAYKEKFKADMRHVGKPIFTDVTAIRVF